MTTTTFDNLITFSRTSNATVVGSNGQIRLAPHNLLPNSQDFDASGWIKTAVTVSTNSINAPDGTMTADTITATGISADGLGRNLATSALTYVFSVYLKQGNTAASEFGIIDQGTAAQRARLTYATGVVTIVAGTATASAVSVGNGWWRVQLTYTFPASGVADTFNVTPGISGSTNGDFCYVWGAQVELGSSATTYNNTSVGNLLGFSEAFDNAAWTKSNSSIVIGAAANPVNGLFNAEKLVEDTTNALHYVANTTNQTGTFNFSAYLKAAERTTAGFARSTDSSGVRFDLVNGTVLVAGAAWSNVSITSVGNGWYRCAGNISLSTAWVYISPNTASSAYQGNGNSGIYIWGAQLSNSASLDPYVHTPGVAPTSAAYYGPRFDFDPVTLAPRGLLVEEQRTNLLLRSEELDNVAWSKSRASVTANATTSPNGTSNADKVIEDTATGSHRVFQQATKAASSLTRTFSVYLKASERALARIQVSDNTELVNANALVDLSTGTIGTASITGGSTISAASATIINAGNGWYRCSITATFDATITNPGAFVALRDASGATSYTGDGTSGMFAWGAMWEDGPFTTSYIPTVASQVTRTVDNAVMTGSNLLPWYNPGEGTFVVEADSFVSTNLINVYNTVSVNDGTGNNQHRLFSYTNRWGGSSNSGGVTQADLQVTGSYTPNVVSKTAYTYRVNDIAVSVSGSAVMTDTAATMPASFDRMGVGSMGTTGHLNGHVRRITYYPRRLSNTQIQELSV
jgi:hypothetical protein